MLRRYFDLLLRRYGPQRWWPADSPFEVMIGAILAQNTAWTNVEKAVDNLKRAKLLDPKRIRDVDVRRLARELKPSGCFNVKARRLLPDGAYERVKPGAKEAEVNSQLLMIERRGAWHGEE